MMPTYPEGTRQWAEQQRDQSYRSALALLTHNGFDPETYGILCGVFDAKFSFPLDVEFYEEANERTRRELMAFDLERVPRDGMQ